MDILHQKSVHDALQVYVSRLHDEYGFDRENIRIAVSIQVGQKRYLANAVVYVNDRPFILIEIQHSPTLHNEQLTNNLEQISSVLGNEYVVITNGLYDLCYAVKKSSKKIQLDEIPDIPSIYSKEKLSKKKQHLQVLLKEPESFFWHIFESLRSDLRLSHIAEKEIMDDLLKIIGAKIFDEKNSDESLFIARDDENYRRIVSRIEKILQNINSTQNADVFEIKFKLPDDLISKIVFKLQKYSLSKSQMSDFPSGFPQIIFSKTAEAYLTPATISSFMTNLFKISPRMNVLDLACGSGTFLVNAGKLGATVVGIDINQYMTNIAKINCYLNGIKNHFILHANSLDSLESLSNQSDGLIQPNSFDLVLTHPPFGLLANKNYANFSMFEISGNKFIETLFIERSWELLKEGGRLVIILPEGITSNKSARKIREFILTNFKVLGIVSLPDGAFAPYSSIKTTILILEKLGPKIFSNSYMIFTANVKHLGFDKQGLSIKETDFPEILENFNKFLRTQKGSVFDSNSNPDLRLDENYFQNTSNLSLKTNVCELKDISDIALGVKNNKLRKGSNYFLIKGQQIKDFEVDLSTASKTGFELIPIDRSLLKKDDIVITRSGTVGNIGLCGDFDKVVFSDNVIRIRVNSDKIIPQYLASFLYSEPGQRQIRQCTTGSTIRGISLSNLEKIQIPLIPISKQQQIVNDLNKILETKSKLNQLTKNLDDSKISLSKTIEKTIEDAAN